MDRSNLDKKIKVALLVGLAARHRTEDTQVIGAVFAGNFKDFFTPGSK